MKKITLSVAIIVFLTTCLSFSNFNEGDIYTKHIRTFSQAEMEGLKSFYSWWETIDFQIYELFEGNNQIKIYIGILIKPNVEVKIFTIATRDRNNKYVFKTNDNYNNQIEGLFYLKDRNNLYVRIDCAKYSGYEQFLQKYYSNKIIKLAFRGKPLLAKNI